MKKPRLATPIFLVRHKAEQDLFKVIRELGELGFEAFEMGGLYGNDPERVRRAAEEAGLEILMDHVPYEEFEADPENVIATRAALGSRYISICRIPADKYPGGANFDEGIRFIGRVAELSKKQGMTLQYHNHGFDFMTRIDGRYPIEWILDALPGELLQHMPDIGWCMLGGGDPLYMLRKYRDRCKVIHLKDYYAEGPTRLTTAHELGGKRGGEDYYNFEFRPTGYGIVGFPGMMNDIMACGPEWITTDHDGSYCGEDYKELVMSREYVENLLKLHSSR
ncbi:MAG: sugar phosphate isomerase/epimerase family protein [Oscillospiraceae bacterium]